MEDLGPVYQHEKITLPKKISRNDFVKLTWELATRESYAWDTTMMAFELSERYCENGSFDELLLWNVDHFYSLELAYTMLTLSAKINEDGDHSLRKAILETNNGYVKILEWKICEQFKYSFRTWNIAKLFGFLLSSERNHTLFCEKSLAPQFLSLFVFVSFRKTLLLANPFAILLGLTILLRRRKKLLDM